MTHTRQTGRRWTGYLPQLFLLTILPLTALVLVIALGGTALHQDVMRDMAGEQALRAARGTAAALGDSLSLRLDLLRGLAARVADGTPPEHILATSTHLLDEFSAGLWIISPEGGVAAQSPGAASLDPARLPVMLAGLSDAAEGYAWMILPDSNPASTPLALLAIPAGDAAIVGAFSPAALARRTIGEVYGPPHSGQHRELFLADAQAGLLFSESHSIDPTDPFARPGVNEALQGESGITYLDIDGVEQVIAFSPVAPLGWALVIMEPWQAEGGTLLRASQLTPLVLVPALLLALVGLWFGARQVIQPLRELEKRAADLAWGADAAAGPPVGGIGEIGRLQVTLEEMARRVRAAQAAMRGYIGAITTGQEEERRRLAREIHDDTLQSIIALRQRAQLAAHRLDGHPARENMTELDSLAEDTINGLRRLLRGLRPSYLEELGLNASLEMLSRETAHASKIPIEFSTSGEERRLDSAVELALYRMTQEALSNMVRHSGASQAAVELIYAPDQVCIEVRDDGRGFRVPENPGEYAPAGHFGLLGLHERAELIGARLELISTPGQGARVRVRMGGERGGRSESGEQRS